MEINTKSANIQVQFCCFEFVFYKTKHVFHHSEYVSESEQFYCHRSEESDEETVSDYDYGNVLEPTDPGTQRPSDNVDNIEQNNDDNNSNNNNRNSVNFYVSVTNSFILRFAH